MFRAKYAPNVCKEAKKYNPQTIYVRFVNSPISNGRKTKQKTKSKPNEFIQNKSQKSEQQIIKIVTMLREYHSVR